MVCFRFNTLLFPIGTLLFSSSHQLAIFDIMGWFTDLTGFIAPFFLIMSPIFSYSDQIISMHRNKSSTGFSLDIPLIMLVASFLRFEEWWSPTLPISG